jgi:hypothetical protein
MTGDVGVPSKWRTGTSQKVIGNHRMLLYFDKDDLTQIIGGAEGPFGGCPDMPDPVDEGTWQSMPIHLALSYPTIAGRGTGRGVFSARSRGTPGKKCKRTADSS